MPSTATRPSSRKGLEERLFTFAFSGLVYPQIWEDPVVDLEALDLEARRASGRHRVRRLQHLQLRDGRRRARHGASTSTRRTWR